MNSKETMQDSTGDIALSLCFSAPTMTEVKSPSSRAADVNAENVMAQVQKKFEKLREEPNKPCIFRIPPVFRGVSVYNDAYTPCRVAIGPYHAKSPCLEAMQQYKLEFVRDLLSYLSKKSSEYEEQVVSSTYIAKTVLTKLNTREAQQHYAGIGGLDMDSFGEMLLIDGAFIVGFLCNYVEFPKDFSPQNELTARGKKEILRDLLLLENQLPFFILDQLFSVFFPTAEDNYFCHIAYSALEVLVPIERETKLLNDDLPASYGVLHLLHLMCICCLPYQRSEDKQLPKSKSFRKGKAALNQAVDSSQPFNTVTELHEAGIRFKRMDPGQSSLLLKFEKGVLEMPRLTLDEFSESFFRNIVAFEQYYLDSFALTSYLYFMDHLIDTANDVQLLQKYDLLENWLESKENVTSIFNCISKYTIYHFNFTLYSLSNDLNSYVRKPWNKYMAKLRHDYFGTPWLVLSFCAALFLLALTVVQTITSLRQVNWI